jgi:amidase
MSGYDLLLTPTMAEIPPRLGEIDTHEDDLGGYKRCLPSGAFTALFNVTGQPAISLPLHWTEKGIPVGVQLVAPFGREDLLIRVAAQIERAAPWHDRIPPVFAGSAE